VGRNEHTEVVGGRKNLSLVGVSRGSGKLWLGMEVLGYPSIYETLKYNTYCTPNALKISII